MARATNQLSDCCAESVSDSRAYQEITTSTAREIRKMVLAMNTYRLTGEGSQSPLKCDALYAQTHMTGVMIHKMQAIIVIKVILFPLPL